MRVRQLSIDNFRGVRTGVVNLHGHTLLVGGNNVGKSTVCEALDLALGSERLFRRPVVDEHDFHDGKYIDSAGRPIMIRIEVILVDLPDELQRKHFGRTRPWSEAAGGFVDVEGVDPAQLDAPGVVRALPVLFFGWYDRKSDDFEGKTYFAHPAPELTDPEDEPGAGYEPFGRDLKQQCGFIYLRTLRTGRRALSLERGSLLDTIMRLGDNGRESMWEDTIKRLKDFDIGTIPQLKTVRTQIGKRMKRFIGLDDDEGATAFFASDLTREHLREVVQFFVRSQGSSYAVPFHRLGTGSINTLVFSLLTHIADLRGNASVIFAMEEPEIALPPHSQRRLTRYLRDRMGQALITSHSPHVIDEFDVTEIVAVDRDSAQVLQSTPIPTAEIKFKAVRQHKLQLAEAILSRGVVVAEGATEVAALIATSSALEKHSPDGDYEAFDLTGISVFDAGAQGEVPKWAPLFASLRKGAFAFHDKPKIAWTEDQLANLRRYDLNCETQYNGIEELLSAEVSAGAQRAFLAAVALWPDYPIQQHGVLPDDANDEGVRALTRKILIERKNGDYAAELIAACNTLGDLPETIVTFLREIDEGWGMPPLHEEKHAGVPEGGPA